METMKGNPECHACFGRGLDCCGIPCVCLEDYTARWEALEALEARRPATQGLRAAPTDEERMRVEITRLREARDACEAAIDRHIETRARLLTERDAARAEAARLRAEVAHALLVVQGWRDGHADVRMTRASALRQMARAIRARGAGGVA